MKYISLLFMVFYTTFAHAADYVWLQSTNESKPLPAFEVQKQIAYGIDYVPITWMALFTEDEISRYANTVDNKSDQSVTAFAPKLEVLRRLDLNMPLLKELCPTTVHISLEQLRELIDSAPGSYIQVKFEDLGWLSFSDNPVEDVKIMTRSFNSNDVKDWGLLLSQAQILTGSTLKDSKFSDDLELQENACTGHFD